MSSLIYTLNPYTQEPLRTYAFHSPIQIEEKLAKAFSLYERSRLTVDARIALLKMAAQRLQDTKIELAELIVQEMGKPISDAIAEIEKSISVFNYFAENLENFLQPKVFEESKDFEIHKFAIGPVLALMPWNYPLWQVVRVLVSCLAVGNPLVLKHAENVSGFAEKLEQLFSQELSGWLQNIRVPVEKIEKIIDDPRIRGVSLTGSVRAGKAVAALAGKCLKKSVLELGGSDAYVVFEDADIQHAANVCANSRMVNNGQSCIAAKRVLVANKIKEEFFAELIKNFQKFIPADPLNKDTKVSCLAGISYKQCLLEQTLALQATHAQKIWDLADEIGFKESASSCVFPARIYQANIFEMSLQSAELFGPVLATAVFSDEAQAISAVNTSIFGLGAAVFSRDLQRAKDFASRLDVGLVGINAQVKSDARYPFGGVKQSGFGKELGAQGFDEFSNQKVYIL